jgi:hypothetical protein
MGAAGNVQGAFAVSLVDLSHVKLAEALEDRASFRSFSGFSRTEATLE